MRLGPLDQEGGFFYEYIVFPGRDGNDAYYAADDDSAIANILHDYEAGELVCEEALAEAGKRFGIEAQPLSQIAAHGLALFALDRFPGKPFQSITEEGLIYHFCTTVSRYFAWLHTPREFALQPLRLHVSGTVEFVTDVYLHDSESAADFLSIMMEKADTASTSDPVLPMELKQYDRMSVARYSTPGFIVDALRRAHGLDFIPIPSVVAKGESRPVTDMQLAILFSTLNAICFLENDSDIGSSEFSINGFQVNCKVCFAATAA